MPVSPQVFRAAFNRFQEIHRQECGFHLDTFRNPASFAHQTEDYKESIAREAGRILDARRWRRAEIGSGSILERVVQAIQLRDNNLLSWQPRYGPQSRVHRPLLDALNLRDARQSFESVFFELYRHQHHDQPRFDALVALCGNRYELLAYLFFIADRNQFLPIRTTSFDVVLSELGFSFKTRGQCRWDNYQQFLAAMSDVQQGLRAEGIVDATLLDAHSFAWILSRFPVGDAGRPGRPARIRRQLFAGTIRDALPAQAFSPVSDAPVVDMAAIAEHRIASGQIAEQVALQAERDRLRDEGRGDLADRVATVSNRPQLGYDLESFEADESPRCIEVKNVSSGNRFFLSRNEWLNSQNRSNFWFYLVSGIDDDRPVVTFLRARSLQLQHLQPTQFLVTFDP